MSYSPRGSNRNKRRRYGFVSQKLKVLTEVFTELKVR
jgi:hypothetical protein